MRRTVAVVPHTHWDREWFAGFQTLRLRLVDLRQLLREVVESYRVAGEEAARLVVQEAERPVLVNVDSSRVRTILTNLVDNALKYSPGGGEVRCLVGVRGRAAVVEVADHGIGIAASDMPRLFARFERLATGENARIPGTGLGLYLSRELARMHGGDLRARSSEGQGSTFTLQLPLAVWSR